MRDIALWGLFWAVILYLMISRKSIGFLIFIVDRASTCLEAPFGNVHYKAWRAGSGEATFLG